MLLVLLDQGGTGLEFFPLDGIPFGILWPIPKQSQKNHPQHKSGSDGIVQTCVKFDGFFLAPFQVLNKGGGHKDARSPEILDMESVSGVSTRTETASGAESSACQAAGEQMAAAERSKTSAH